MTLDDPYQPAPPVSEALLDYLERTFPASIPHNLWDSADPLGEIRKLQGNLEVLAHLRSLHLNQTNDDV